MGDKDTDEVKVGLPHYVVGGKKKENDNKGCILIFSTLSI